MRAFLIGGGRDPRGVVASHAPFVAAVRDAGDGVPVTVFVLDEGDGADVDEERWSGALRMAGASGAQVVAVSPERPPRPDDLEGSGGVYVAGGWTPGYRDVLAGAGTGWLEAARERGLPYAGFSAGAAIAPRRAVVGGWRATIPDGDPREVCDEDAGEGLDLVEVRDGLGIVEPAVDVHAAQWGTLTRLVAAVLAGGIGDAFAIDEHTTLEVHGGRAVVHGLGAAHRVRPGEPGRVAVDVLVAGDAVDV